MSKVSDRVRALAQVPPPLRWESPSGYASAHVTPGGFLFVGWGRNGRPPKERGEGMTAEDALSLALFIFDNFGEPEDALSTIRQRLADWAEDVKLQKGSGQEEVRDE